MVVCLLGMCKGEGLVGLLMVSKTQFPTDRAEDQAGVHFWAAVHSRLCTTKSYPVEKGTIYITGIFAVTIFCHLEVKCLEEELSASKSCRGAVWVGRALPVFPTHTSPLPPALHPRE